jgi:V/A-type H+-transporting ATPase subunit C
MLGYEYGNTRLRAMKSQLIPKEMLESLASTETIESYITALTKTPYSRAIESAITRVSGLAIITEAIHQDLNETVGKIQTFYEGTAASCVEQLLRDYDLQNLKAVLRGLSQQIAPDEIMAAILPVGVIPESIWKLLIRCEGSREAIDLLATLGQPFAQPLLELRAENPGASIADMELALEHSYFIQVKDFTLTSGGVPVALVASLNLEADLENISTAIRFAYAPAERARLNHHGLRRYFVGPGEISFQTLESAGEQDSLQAAIQILSNTPYAKILWSGLKSFEDSGRLSDIELYLRRYRLHWSRVQMSKDPLGIGVPIGYLALKTNEVGNLRWIAHGLRQGIDKQIIQAGMEF